MLTILERVARKQRLLKRTLQIESKSQHVNFLNKHKAGIRQFRTQMEPRSALEYIRLGQMMQLYLDELSVLNNQRKCDASARETILGPRTTVYVIATKKSGAIAASKQEKHLSEMEEIKRKTKVDGRVYEYFWLDDKEKFLDCAARYSVLEQALQCL